MNHPNIFSPLTDKTLALGDANKFNEKIIKLLVKNLLFCSLLGNKPINNSKNIGEADL